MRGWGSRERIGWGRVVGRIHVSEVRFTIIVALRMGLLGLWCGRCWW